MPADTSDSDVLETAKTCIGSQLARCVHCRREMEASLSRIEGRRARQARGFDECSVAKCIEFIRGIDDEAMRMHLASMAWWRFSTDSSGIADPLLAIAKSSRATVPEYGEDYMHRVVKTLSPLSMAQLSVWFGCNTLYSLVDAFMGEHPDIVGEHCQQCGLYRHGCDASRMLWANDCQLWKDKFVQEVAGVVSKDMGWRDPCRGMRKPSRRKK